MQNLLGKLQGSLNFNFGKLDVPIPYWQAIAIVVLVFFLVILMAKFRRHVVDYSLRGAVFGIFFGFLLALIIEGFLIIGGKTALTSVLGWKNPPKAVANVLDLGKDKLIQVLGISTSIPSSFAKDSVSVQSTIEMLQSLNPEEREKVQSILCE